MHFNNASTLQARTCMDGWTGHVRHLLQAGHLLSEIRMMKGE